MKTPPSATELARESMIHLLSRCWNIEEAQLTYLPVGFGSHHWLAEGAGGRTVFVTADNVEQRPDGVEALNRALTTTWHLRHGSGIEAVVAPIATTDGDLVAILDDDWAVAVFPYLPVEPSNWGVFGNEADRERAQQLVGQVHAASRNVLTSVTPSRETFEIPNRAELFERLAEPLTAWTSGPYGERTRSLLLQHTDQIQTGLALYDELVSDAISDDADWVVTHGEPHAGNIVRRSDNGELVIVDWDTCALAPRERDLWQLFPPDDRSLSSLGSYAQAAGLEVEVISQDRLDLYRLHWDLEEVAIYADWYCQPHEDTEDTRTGWEGLVSSINLLAGHLERK
jgi:spectinomycin phosphotransferase